MTRRTVRFAVAALALAALVAGAAEASLQEQGDTYIKP